MSKFSVTPVKTHQECPLCHHKGCTSVWAAGNWYCHSCGKDGNDYEEMKDDVPSEDTEVTAVPAVKPSRVRVPNVPYRGVSVKVQDFYDVKNYVEKGKESTWTSPDVRSYPYPDGHTKWREVATKNFRTSKGFKQRFFGLEKFSPGSKSRYIVIVEGEEDVLAAREMLSEMVPVIGMPSATPKVADLLDMETVTKLKGWDEIILIPDNDKAGKKILPTFGKIFGKKLRVVNLTKHKDPSDYLQNGGVEKFLEEYSGRSIYVPEYIHSGPTALRSILSRDSKTEFYPTPMDSLNEVIKGFPLGHLVVITGHEGLGKTEFLRWVEYNYLIERSVPIGVCHLEESGKTTLETFACYELGKNVRDPDHKVPKETVEEAVVNLCKNNLFLFDADEGDPLSLLDRITYLATVHGVKNFFIDPIQQLAYDSSSTLSEEQVLTQLSVKLEKLCVDLGIMVAVTAHVNDDGQTRSSRMIGKAASIRIDLVRDHMNDDDAIRNTTNFYVTKNRPTGSTGFGGKAYFDISSFTLQEVL